MLSVIVPCFNEENSIQPLYRRLIPILLGIDDSYEILFVDDGSTDRSLAEMKTISEQDPQVSYIRLSRNFGKESAMYAGLCNVKGDYVAVMDADLQDPPELLPRMLEMIRSGECDCAAARRTTRKGEPMVRSFFARLFYRIINKVTDTEILDGARDFRLMKREMVDAIVSMSEYNRFSKGLFGWVGFCTQWISYDNVARSQGKSKWSFWRLMKYAVSGIINFSQTPLNIVSGMGLLLTLVSFFALLLIVIRRIFFGDPVLGWASTFCLIIFMGGCQLFSIGVLGQYVGRTYMETKNRPHYIIAESNLEQIKRIH